MNDIIKKILTQVTKDQAIKEFIIENNISNDCFARSIVAFKTQYNNNKICSSCNKEKCLLEYEYMKSSLVLNGNTVDLEYKECPYEINLSERLQMIYFPKMDNIENMETNSNEERAEVLKYMMQFLDTMTGKGIFLHGKYGTGKTFLFYKFARLIAEKNKNVILAYYPDLVRYLKSCISDGTLEKEIVRLKKVDVLFLDDVGGENNTPYVRDEILCPILQYRLLENKPVFMTSNYDLELLGNHFMESRDDINKMASDRIIERIRALMNIVELKGENLR